MATFDPKLYQTSSGLGVVIRSAVAADAARVLALAKSVIGEEIYQLTSSEEFTLSEEDEKKWIESHLNDPYQIVLVAETQNQIVGMLDFTNGRRQRIAHTGEFGMSVAKDFRDQGIGTLLLNSMFDWARSTGKIEKIGLHVHANNDRAVSVYRKVGFEIEGIRKRELKYGPDNYVDTVFMSKFL